MKCEEVSNQLIAYLDRRANSAERQEVESFRSSKSSPTATIGDAILAKRQSS